MKTLLTMSLTGGLLALLVVALRAVLREKLHPRLVYALWLPVLICLLVPVRLPSAVSVLNAPPVQRVQTAVQQQMEVPLPIQGEWQTAAPVQEDPLFSAPETPVYEPAAPAKEERKLDVWAVAGWVWAAGALAVAAYTLAVNLRFALRVRRSRQPVALSGATARSLRGMRVYCSRAVPSPCLMGVLRPYIVVTPLALESEQRLRHVLMHERSHKRQGDHWFALLRSAALVVHWFNPLVWWAAALSREDGENACDALALRALGEEERIDYGKTLLAFLHKKPSASALVNTSTAMAQSRGQIRRRIALISKKRKYTVLLAALAVALVLAGCAATMTDAQPTATVDTAPETTPEVTAPVSPTPAPETPPPDERPDAVRDKMEELENNIADLAPAFSSLTAEETGALLPELSTDFALYGRRNEQGETYAIAVGKPGHLRSL